VFKTVSGRTVYGGGGITPDYIVKMADAPSFVYQFQVKRIFLEYVDSRYTQRQDELQKEYKNSENFNEKFQVTDEILSEIFDRAKKGGIKVTREEYDKNPKYIAMLVKAQIARNVWGNEGWYRVVLTFDNQFEKAMTLFPEAKEIAGLR